MKFYRASETLVGKIRLGTQIKLSQLVVNFEYDLIVSDVCSKPA